MKSAVITPVTGLKSSGVKLTDIKTEKTMSKSTSIVGTIADAVSPLVAKATDGEVIVKTAPTEEETAKAKKIVWGAIGFVVVLVVGIVYYKKRKSKKKNVR